MKDLPEFTACVLEIDQNLVLWVDMTLYSIKYCAFSGDCLY